jgi:hypothetical protein
MLSASIYCYVECHYAECRDVSHLLNSHAELSYSKCLYAKRHYSECRGASFRAL